MDTFISFFKAYYSIINLNNYFLLVTIIVLSINAAM